MARFSGEPEARSLGASARIAVLRQLLGAAKAWSAVEASYTQAGDWANAEGAHTHGGYVLRAYAAELDDPTPKGLR